MKNLPKLGFPNLPMLETALEEAEEEGESVAEFLLPIIKEQVLSHPSLQGRATFMAALCWHLMNKTYEYTLSTMPESQRKEFTGYANAYTSAREREDEEETPT